MDNLRKLAYAFFDLPYYKRLEIAFDMQLTSKEDTDLTAIQKTQNYFRRAKEKNLLKELWDKTYNNPKIVNPFSHE